MDTLALLRKLSEAYGISGYEDGVRAVVRQALEPFADEFRVDTLGSLIATRRANRPSAGPRRSIMLAGHMDEVGLIVTDIVQGMIRVFQVVGMDRRTLPGQEVIVHGQRDLPGVIAARPPHVLAAADYEKAVPWEQLFIDTGLPEATVNELVRVGDLVSFNREFLELADGQVSGKAFDDRASVASLAVCLEMLATLGHKWDVYAISTCQEETGLKGATAAAFDLTPDIGIAVDMGFSPQRGVSDHETVRAPDGEIIAIGLVNINEGPGLAIGPSAHPKMQARLAATAKKYEIPLQTMIAAGFWGTDGWAMQVTRCGIPTALLSIPARYMHTSVETTNIKDIERTGRLLAYFISELDEAFARDLGL